MIHRVNGSIVASYTAKDKFPFLLHSVSLYNLFQSETLFTFQMFIMSSAFYSCDYILSDWCALESHFTNMNEMGAFHYILFVCTYLE